MRKLSIGHCCTASDRVQRPLPPSLGAPLPSFRLAARRPAVQSRRAGAPQPPLPPRFPARASRRRAPSPILSACARQGEPTVMPIATPEVYAQMLDRAKKDGFAYPSINVTSSQTLNAALRGFADAGSDGIVQVSTGGAEYLSGTVKNMVTGAVALAEYAKVVAARYPVHIALHTDHCPKDKLDGYMRPLIELSAERVVHGQEPLFQSHMWDGSAVPLDENLEI